MDFSASQGKHGGHSERNKSKEMVKQNQAPRQQEDGTSTFECEENWPISMDKPFVHLVFVKNQVGPPYHLVFPAKMRPNLPRVKAPVVLNCRNKNWKMNFHGDKGAPYFDMGGWKNFVIDNKLKVGDGCVFELHECSSDCIKFRVQILDGEIPLELVNKYGGSSSDPISII